MKRGDPGRILVVDDQRTVAEMTAGVLRNLGHEVQIALDGESALRELGGDRFDLVVCDIMMPGMDGYEVCRRLRADPATTLLPVVLVTSADPQAERIKGIEAGAGGLFFQPGNLAGVFRPGQRLLRGET